MRVLAAIVLVGLVGSPDPDAPRRYRVIPTAQDADTGFLACPPSLSANGLTVAYESRAAHDPADTNDRLDVYVMDRTARQVTLVSRRPDGTSGRGNSRCPRISGDGQRVAFESDVADLVDGDAPGTADVFVFDRGTGELRRVVPSGATGETTSSRPALSADGRVLVFDAKVASVPSAMRPRVYRTSLDAPSDVEDLGEGHSAAVNRDGSVVAFVTSPRPGGPQVIRVVGAATQTVAPPEGEAGDVFAPSLSADGQWLSYVTRPPSTVAGQRAPRCSQVHVVRLSDGQRRLVSATPGGGEGNGHSRMPVIDADGMRVVFESTATNLGCGTRGGQSCKTDINLLADVFAWDRATATVTRINVVTPDLCLARGRQRPGNQPRRVDDGFRLASAREYCRRTRHVRPVSHRTPVGTACDRRHRRADVDGRRRAIRAGDGRCRYDLAHGHRRALHAPHCFGAADARRGRRGRPPAQSCRVVRLVRG